MLTSILVRPAARGGKFLGPDAANADNHSALVTISDASTGKILEQQFVSTLNKDAGPSNIMAPVSRAEPFSTDPSTVGVRFDLNISQPTQLRITAHGPLKHPDQARTAEAQFNLLPGVAIGSNVLDAQTPVFAQGIVIEIPGLCISNVKHELSGEKLYCHAKVTMMCGCEIHDDATWFWPSTDFNIQLWTYMKSGNLHQYTLRYDNSKSVKPSHFVGEWETVAAPGDSIVSAWLTASQPKMGNEGYRQIV